MTKVRIVGFAAAATIGVVSIALGSSSVGGPLYREQLSFDSDQPLTQSRSIPTGEIVGAGRIGQTFIATQPNLGRIDVFLSNYLRPNEAPVVLSLRAAGSEEVLRTSVAPAGSVGDNRYHAFTFEPIRRSANRMFEVLVSSPGADPGRSITGWLSERDTYPSGSASVDGEPLYRNDLAMLASYRVRIKGVVDELVNRLSQYKPGFLKGSAIPVILILAIALILVAAFSVARSTTEDTDVGATKASDDSANSGRA